MFWTGPEFWICLNFSGLFWTFSGLVSGLFIFFFCHVHVHHFLFVSYPFDLRFMGKSLHVCTASVYSNACQGDWHTFKWLTLELAYLCIMFGPLSPSCPVKS